VPWSVIAWFAAAPNPGPANVARDRKRAVPGHLPLPLRKRARTAATGRKPASPANDR
jgi:hypothetical protein